MLQPTTDYKCFWEMYPSHMVDQEGRAAKHQKLDWDEEHNMREWSKNAVTAEQQEKLVNHKLSEEHKTIISWSQSTTSGCIFVTCLSTICMYVEMSLMVI